MAKTILLGVLLSIIFLSIASAENVKSNKVTIRRIHKLAKAYEKASAKEVVIFKISAQGLPNKDVFGGKPDPFVVVSYRNGSSGEYETFARTETFPDNSDPYWKDYIIFHDYIRGNRQTIRFEFRDHDQGIWDDRIGYAYINVDDCLWESRSRITETSACQAQIQDTNGVVFFYVV